MRQVALVIVTTGIFPSVKIIEIAAVEMQDGVATGHAFNVMINPDMEMAEEAIHKQFGVPFIFFKRPQWDKFPGADETFAADCLMPDGVG